MGRLIKFCLQNSLIWEKKKESSYWVFGWCCSFLICRKIAKKKLWKHKGELLRKFYTMACIFNVPTSKHRKNQIYWQMLIFASLIPVCFFACLLLGVMIAQTPFVNLAASLGRNQKSRSLITSLQRIGENLVKIFIFNLRAVWKENQLFLAPPYFYCQHSETAVTWG